MEQDQTDKAREPDEEWGPAGPEKPRPPAPPIPRSRGSAAVAAWFPAEAPAADAAAPTGDGDADMPRPFCKRFVGWQPGVSLFKPAGVPAGELEVVVLSLDEVEALRLADLNAQYQEAAADQMKISRATFARIVESARRKVADALVHGKALQIQTEPGAQPPAPATAPGACHRRGCGCHGKGHGHGRYVEYSPRKEQP
ncbi:MAG: DUF134 domain-containing protein [Kiritimatiellia bacterium]